MRGYSKIKEGNLFSQRSKSKKDFPFLDQDFDVPHDFYLPKNSTFIAKSSLENEPKPTNIIDEDSNKKKRNGFILGKKSEEHAHDHDDDHQYQDNQDEQLHVKYNGEKKKIGGVLKRNFTVSSSTTSSFAYQKSNTNLERQSSTRAIQEVVKRAFSMRRSSSVNSDRYCRIYDQSLHVQDFDNYDCVYDDCNNGDYNHQNDEFERSSIGSMEESTRSKSMKKKMSNKDDDNNATKICVRSKVARACKRLFNR